MTSSASTCVQTVMVYTDPRIRRRIDSETTLTQWANGAFKCRAAEGYLATAARLRGMNFSLSKFTPSRLDKASRISAASPSFHPDICRAPIYTRFCYPT